MACLRVAARLAGVASRAGAIGSLQVALTGIELSAHDLHAGANVEVADLVVCTHDDGRPLVAVRSKNARGTCRVEGRQLRAERVVARVRRLLDVVRDELEDSVGARAR